MALTSISRPAILTRRFFRYSARRFAASTPTTQPLRPTAGLVGARRVRGRRVRRRRNCRRPRRRHQRKPRCDRASAARTRARRRPRCRSRTRRFPRCSICSRRSASFRRRSRSTMRDRGRKRSSARWDRECPLSVISSRAQNPTGAAITEQRASDLRRILRQRPRALLIEIDDCRGRLQVLRW